MNDSDLFFKKLQAGAEELTKNKKNVKIKTGTKVLIVIVIILIILGGIGAYLGTIIPGYIKEKRSQFPNNRCTDAITMKFPNFFGPPGMTFAKNKQFCDSAALSETQKKNNIPLQNQLNKQNETMFGVVQHIKDTKKMIYHIRQGIITEAKDAQQKIYNTYKRLAYVFKVFARLFYRVFVVFKDLFVTLKYAIWTLMSIWNGPMGGFIRVFCFSENTIIDIERKNKQYSLNIRDVELDDMIGDNRVIGLCRFKRDKRDDMYKYNGVYVSGMHLVEIDGKLERIEKQKEAMRVKYEGTNIYSFITNTGKMIINKNKFGDYLGDNTFETYNKIVDTLFTNNPLKNGNFCGTELDKYEESAINLYPGFTYNSIIETDNGKKEAKCLEIGDKIGGKEILGIINYKIEGRTFIERIDDAMLVGIQYYKINNSYEIYKMEERWILGKLLCIGILIEGGVIKIGDHEIADFDIISDELRLKAEENICV